MKNEFDIEMFYDGSCPLCIRETNRDCNPIDAQLKSGLAPPVVTFGGIGRCAV